MYFSELLESIEIENAVLIRDGEFEVWDYCTSESQKLILSFIERKNFIKQMSSQVGCVFCTEEIAEEIPESMGICLVNEPKRAFHIVHNYFAMKKEREKKTETRIAEGVSIAESATIAMYNVIIKKGAKIGPNVIVGENVTIGENVNIHGNSVIGGQSFSKVRCKNGDVLGLSDMGRTIIEDGVEIYPMVHIANGILPSDVTWIKRNAVIDAQTYVGHGVHIGETTLVAANVSISGNVHIGNDVWIGIGATIRNRVKIGNNARVSMGAVVTKDVLDEQTVTGNFAIEHEKFLANQKALI